MTASTHIITAAIYMTTINIISGNPLHPASLVVAGFTSLLPDVDHPESHVGRLCKPLSGFLYRKVGHRTLTHSIFGWMLAGFAFWPLKWLGFNVNVYNAAIIGYISHSMIDLTNLDGVALTYPVAKHHRWVFPADVDYRIKTDSPKEQMLRVIALLILGGLIALNLAGAKSMFHSFLGTAEAIGRDYASQLKDGYRLVVKVEGVWVRGQTHVSETFDVIAATEDAIFVRRPSDPLKVYLITGSGATAISHTKLKILRKIKAQQRVVKITFERESWKSELATQYPNALVSGSLSTRASPPHYDLDEFPTITRFGGEWELTYAPVELVSQSLQASGVKISGEIQIRYWQEK